MCGRYASFRDAQDLADEFAVAEIADDARLLPPSWNLAPTDPVRIVVERAAKDTGEVRRSLRVARWGLVPSWSKSPAGGARMINARAETILDKPAFAKPFGVRRCLVPADGYYEWRPLPDGASPVGSPAPATGRRKPPKQPYFIAPDDGGGAAFAGLYEFWRDRTRADDDPERWLVSTTIITTDAAPCLAEIHDRMPLALPARTWDDWLDPALDARGAADLLGLGGPHDDVPMTAREVSTTVNSVTNDGPGLLERV
ncbi:SOS response-associated peptidase [Cellulosimicrobium arenosum]|uniref:Abasic site processing protein n=1 Tax=Cellulosimicrobium arenosum TaxID=2708133 RepID=A0A927IYY0_9MICO|nr:SOS response-associated peptidase [Cellulosimicrobium arenosum]MBD8078055.1 SOS response-associated peptidase [Cellulosimicrobium arenosum]